MLLAAWMYLHVSFPLSLVLQVLSVQCNRWSSLWLYNKLWLDTLCLLVLIIP